LLAGGGAAGAAMLIGIRPWSATPASAAGGVPDYLGRSSYLTLSTPSFGSSLNGSTSDLTLEAVTDLDARLAGSEDAFSLLFAAGKPVEAGTRSFSHPDLGVFEFFIAPVEGNGKYEVVVNRSVAAPKHVPKPQPSTASRPAASPPAQEKKPGHHTKRPHVRRVSARRLAHRVVCEIALNADTTLKSATVWLSRGGLVVATTTVRHVHGSRVAVNLPLEHRARGGRYEVTVATKDRHGHTEYKRANIVLQ
jgi:hypothetical protein